MRVLVIEDHPLMAEAIGFAMRSFDSAAQVDIAGNLKDAMTRVADTAYDLCLLDLGLPDCTGLDALARMRERFPAQPVVVVSGANEPESVLAALELGAMGYIPKTSPRDVLLGAVRLVASGGIYVPVEALKLRATHEPPPAGSPPAAKPGKTAAELGLSARQWEVLRLLLQGMPNKLIARKLDISENTTKIHVSAVLRALGVATRTQALIAANRLGLRLDV